MITQEIIRYIQYAKKGGCLVTGTQDMSVDNINVVDTQMLSSRNEV